MRLLKVLYVVGGIQILVGTIIQSLPDCPQLLRWDYLRIARYSPIGKILTNNISAPSLQLLALNVTFSVIVFQLVQAGGLRQTS